MSRYLARRPPAQSAVFTFALSLIIHLGASYIVKRSGDPYFLKTPSNITVNEGELAVLKCHVERLGPKMVNVVVWRKTDDDFPLTVGELTFSPNSDISIAHSPLTKTSSTWDLHIKNVQQKHAGTYECQISANHLIAQYVTLNVLERPKTRSAIMIKGEKYVMGGSVIHLICNVTGMTRTPETVDWFFEGNRIVLSDPRWRDRVHIIKHTSIEGKFYVSELYIKQTRLVDKGNYICRSDLSVDSINVIVLNYDKDNLTRRESENQIETRKSALNCGHIISYSDYFSVLLFAVIAFTLR